MALSSPRAGQVAVTGRWRLYFDGGGCLMGGVTIHRRTQSVCISMQGREPGQWMPHLLLPPEMRRPLFVCSWKPENMGT